MSNMTTTSIANKPIMIVETDPKNEIDDEIFIHWANLTTRPGSWNRAGFL